jgi:hypothetical protein
MRAAYVKIPPIMRGDSLRDLYAKFLALMGLGVLAGAGALVDYWPAGVRLVPVEAVTAVAVADDAAIGPLAVPASTTPVAVPAAQVARVVSSMPDPHDVRLADIRLVSAPRRTMAASMTAPGTMPGLIKLRPVAWTTPPTPSLAVIAAANLSGTDVPLSYPERFERSDARHFVPAVAASNGLDDSDGFITGAVKRTGSTIVKTGARTGASLMEAMRAVGGAMRKALPN